MEKKTYKDSLLKYLCMALPYGVMMGNKEWQRTPYQLTCDNLEYSMMTDDWDDVPYLRPMSSMTEEEINELRHLCEEDLTDFSKHIADGHGLSHDGLYMFPNIRQLNWLLAHHFDFMGLIPVDCAIDCTGLDIYKD